MIRNYLTLIIVIACFTAFSEPGTKNSEKGKYYVGGTGASDSNPGTTAQPFATIQKAATVAMAGDIVNFRTGTYRETITPANSGTPGNPIVYQPDGDAVVTVSGADIADSDWKVYSGNIYQKTISLPVNGYNDHATNNTTLMANQVFVNGNMMIEARWPNVSDSNDLMKKSDFRDGTIGAWGSVPQLRINCGGTLIEGNQLEDKPFTPECWGYTGFSGTYSTTDAITNTYSVYDAMKTARYGAGHYLITTQNGTYQVKMDFAEIVDTSSSRKFNIKVEGQTVASNIDIFTLSGGHDRGYEFVFKTQVTDGQMDIEFVAVNGQPMVSEIELNYLRPATLTDPAIPQITGGWVGGQIWINGWYQTYTSPITAQNGTQITFDKSADAVFRKFYYLTGRLGALDVEKEWFYDGTTLYLWVPGSGSPANVEVKKRNYAFDLSGKSYITVKDIKIFAATIISNSSSANIVVDGINAKYISHYVTHPASNSSGSYIQGGSGHMLETGILLMGPDNVIQNSEIQYSAGNGIVLGESGAVAHNNLIHDISYGGKFECALFPAPNLNNNTVGVAQTITRNTAYRLGRSAIHGIYMNKDIGYNDFYAYGLLNNDVGALYSDCIATLPDDPGVNCTGTRIHHNWLHDCAADERQGSGIYFDQGSGGGSQVDHNVIWNTLETDAYSEIKNRMQIKWYNNTFGSSESDETLYSWLSYYVGGVSDDAKNNIYNMPFHRGAWKKGGNENYFTEDNSLTNFTNPLFVNEGAHDFHLQLNSPAINTGKVISSVTDGYVGNAPDKGAYEYGGTNWVPGYIAPGAKQTTISKPQLDHYYKGSELILPGVDKTNPFIYDNDIFNDMVDIYFEIAMSKLNGGTMKGIVVTYDINEPHISFQSQMDDANSAVKRCRDSNMGTIPDPKFGSPGKLTRPASGNIEDTPFTISDGSTLIVNAANTYGTVDKPLVVFIGGQPSTVAVAYLQDPSIADKVIVCHVDPLGYNGADSWATYICAKKMRYFAWGDKLWWWSGTYEKQVIIDNPPILQDSGFDALPDNPVCTYLKTTYKNNWPNKVYHDLGDGALAIYFQDKTQFSVVQKRNASYNNGCVFTDTNDSQFDVLTVSDMTADNMRKQGFTFFEVMGNPQVYAK